MTQGESNWGQTRVKLTGVDPRLVAGRARDGEGVRVSSSGDQMAGGGHLSDASTRSRRVVWVVGPGVAGVVAGVDLGGRRGSGEVGVGATVHVRASGCVR